MTTIFLGMPPANVERWIKDHAAPAEHPETRFTLSDGTVETHNITGSFDMGWMIDNGYFDESDWSWKKTITQADIGTTVTSIEDSAFSGCGNLTSVTLPDSVMYIEWGVFSDCSGLTSVTIVANGGNANNVKQMVIDAFGDTEIPDNITWNMPS